jgi:nucleoside-diphosphate-sugar epimerase
MDHPTRTALVFGASGQLGVPLLAQLRAAGWDVVAVSRQARADTAGVRWLRGGFDALPQLPQEVGAVFSCGPLDHFACWYAASRVRAPRVVAFGSTSAATKHDSVDAHERDLASRLRQAETRVLADAGARGAAATVLRPTLVYGAGRDHTLTRIARLARRWGVFPLPVDARGLRQPVHVDDLASAAIAAASAPASAGRAYDLPGGETLPYAEMVARVLACLAPPPRLIQWPSPLFRAALALAQAGGVGAGFGPAAVARMREDLVFDADPARRDLGYAPRPFRPAAAMFDPG